MMWKVLRRLKSWSLTKLTAGGAVMSVCAFEKTKGESDGGRILCP